MTVYTDNAHRFATRRNTALARATADHILSIGCRRAVDAIRDPAGDDPVLLLADAQRRAARLLDPQTAAVSTSTPEAAARPDVHPEGEAGGRPATTGGERS